MLRSLIISVTTLIPLVGVACESSTRQKCEEKFGALVSYRTEAIENAFGDLSGALPEEIQIKFVQRKDPEYAHFAGREAYDRESRSLIIPHRVLVAKTPNPLRWAVSYWPFYEDGRYRQMYPVVEAIDNLLWSAYLQEAAKTQGLSWPHKDCASSEISKRLPCEMLIKGIAEHVKGVRGPLFNLNRLDRIWPEDFSEFRKRVWRTDDQEYLDVQRYGGFLLMDMLISEFGVPRALAYVAQTPFRMEEDNLRISALRYQARAREALTLQSAGNQPSMSGWRGQDVLKSSSHHVPRVRVSAATAE